MCKVYYYDETVHFDSCNNCKLDNKIAEIDFIIQSVYNNYSDVREKSIKLKELRAKKVKLQSFQSYPAVPSTDNYKRLNDKDLIKDAKFAAQDFEKELVDIDLYTKSWSKTKLEEAVTNLVSLTGNGNAKAYKEAFDNFKEILTYYVSLRRQYGEFTKLDIMTMIEEMKRQAEKELEGELSCNYIPTAIDLDTDYDVDIVLAENKVPESRQKQDRKYSNALVMAVFNRMDPKGEGFATQPMKFRGNFITKYGRKLPLKHSKIPQSLFWLKQTIRIETRLTIEDKHSLWTFINASWEEHFNKRVKNDIDDALLNI